MLSSREATEQEVQATGLVHRVHLPDTAAAAPLVLMVHGRAGDLRSTWVFSRAARALQPVVVTPQAPLADPIGGFSWWLVETAPGSQSSSNKKVTREHLTEPVTHLENFIDAVKSIYPVDSNRIYAVGFSQGGAILSTLVLKRPGLIKGLAMLSSFIPDIVLKDFDSANIPELPKLFFAHGTNDPVIPIDRAVNTVKLLTDLKADVTFHQDPVGHKIGSDGIKALAEWLQSVSGALPPKI